LPKEFLERIIQLENSDKYYKLFILAYLRTKIMADGEKESKSLIEQFKKLAAGTQKVDGKFNELADGAVNSATVALRKFSEIVGNNTQDLEKFTNIGSSFGNSLNAMKIAAAESRVSLEDFYEILEKNNKSFAGLGGTVAEGSKEFAKLSRSFYDSGFAENLKQMGYTGKELNEVLALQVGISKSNMETTEEGRTRSLKSAAELAYQMDEISKLTGKTRKEQMESMKEQQRDMKLEAALRQQTAGMSKEDADAYRKQVMAHIEEVKNTMGPAAANAAKEIATSGTLQTQASRQYVATHGEAAQSMIKSTQLIKERDFAEAERERRRAQAEAIAIQDNKAYQDLIIHNTKVAGVVGDSMTATQPLYDGVKNQLQGTGTQIVNLGDKAGEVAGALGTMRESVKKEQEARDPLTSLMVRTADRLKDAEAALTRQVRSTMTDPNQGLGKEMMDASNRRSGGVAPKTTPEDIAAKRNEAIQAQKEGKDVVFGYRDAYERAAKPIVDNFVKPATELMGTGVKLADKGLSAAGTFAENLGKEINAINEVLGRNKAKAAESTNTGPDAQKEKRDSGTLGLTGMMFEPKDIVTKVQKGESVMTETQMKSLMKGSQTQGMESLLREMVTGMKQTSSGAGGVNLEKIAKDIVTTTSKVEVTNWPKNMGKVEVKQQATAGTQVAASPKQESKADDKKATTKADDKKTTDTAKEEKPKATQASVRAVDNAMDKASVEPKTTQTSTTKLTVNGRDVDPNSQEGQAAMKQLDDTAKKTEEAIKKLTDTMGAGGSTVTLDTKSIEDMAKSSGIQMSEAQRQVDATAPTAKVSGPSMTTKSSAEFLLDNQITQASSNMRGLGAVDKGALNDALSLSEKEREEKKKKYQEEYDLAQKEVSDRDKRLIEIEKRYEDEGRAADAKNDEEYKRLEAEEKIFVEQRGNAQKNLQALKEVDDIKRKVEDQGYDFEKVNAARLESIKQGTTEVVRKFSEEELAGVTLSKTKQLEQAKALTQVSDEDYKKSKLEELEREKNQQAMLTGVKEELNKDILTLETKSQTEQLTGLEKFKLENLKKQREEVDEQLQIKEEHIAKVQGKLDKLDKVVEKSADNMVSAYDTMADDVEELSKVLPETTGKAFSDMTMEADEMAAEMANTLASSDVLESVQGLKDNVGQQFDSMADDVEEMTKVLPETSTRALGDMTMEADEMAAELQNTIAGSDVLESVQGSISGFDEDEYGEGGDAIGGELDRSFEEDEYGKGNDLIGGVDPGDESVAGFDAYGGPGDASVAGMDYVAQAFKDAQQVMPQTMFKPMEVNHGLDVAPSSAASPNTPKDDKKTMPALDAFQLDANGMPMVSRHQQKLAKDPEKDNKAKQEKEADKSKDGSGSKGEAGKDKQQAAAGGAKTSNKTLDDVVKALETLNTSVNKLSSKVEESSKNQVNATKSALSGNLFVK
jgi:hypothetical protein